MSAYQSMVDFIERRVTPLAGTVGQQRHVIAIRDGFIAALPFMIIGSFMLVFIFPPFSPDTTNGFARGWLNLSLKYREELMLPWYLSMGVMTFFISVGIGASLGKHYKLDPIMTGLLAFMASCWWLRPITISRFRRSSSPEREFSRLFSPRFTPPRCTPFLSATILRSACRKRCRP